MNHLSLSKLSTALLAFAFPFMVGCSVFTSSSLSSDPVIADQQRRVEALKAEVTKAEQDVEYAEEKEKAAKSRLKAAQDQLRVMQTEAKRRNG
ncbi:hypothetical protein [Rufibacter immobilis]|uniref:hypothetical protein n=1 Tax=Rufibacter immobilis TaxID=1348778 RepID=UPI0035EB73E6